MTGFEVRPRRIRLIAAMCAGVIVVAFTVAAVLLTSDGTGVYFRPADQVSLVILGLLLGGAVLLLARPRVRADDDGVAVRNILGERRYAWTLVRDVAFPRGAPWARLELPDDEYVPVLAIQAMDGERAVTAIERLRALYARSGTRGKA